MVLWESITHHQYWNPAFHDGFVIPGGIFEKCYRRIEVVIRVKLTSGYSTEMEPKSHRENWVLWNEIMLQQYNSLLGIEESAL
jgi:hypothetical protein